MDMYFSRDERAIAETELKYGALCRHISKNILSSDEDTEECLNDTYLAIWNSIPPTRPTSLAAFAVGVTRRQALKRAEYQNRQKRSCTVAESLDELADLVGDGASVDESLDEKETARLIEDFLRAQKRLPRCVFIRRYYFFDSVASIAQMYSISESRVKSILFRCRKALREYLSASGVNV